MIGTMSVSQEHPPISSLWQASPRPVPCLARDRILSGASHATSATDKSLISRLAFPSSPSLSHWFFVVFFFVFRPASRFRR